MTGIPTRVTKLLGITYPIVQGGMIWVSGWRLAAAVSEAGGLGIIGAGSMDDQLLAQHIRRLRRATQRPFGVNVPVGGRHAPDHIRVCLELGVPVLFTSAGDPKKHTRQLQGAGAIVAHVVPSARLAVKAQDAGCDAIVAEGTEAGGHNGFDQITTMNLVPQVVDAVSVPVIAAGGIADGRGVAAAIALGAEGAQLGTRFAATRESSASQPYKEAVVRAGEADTRLYLCDLMPTRALTNAYVERAIEAERRGAKREELVAIRGKGRARRGIFDGDLVEGELEAGQAAGRIGELPAVSELMVRLVGEYRAAVDRLEPGSQ